METKKRVRVQISFEMEGDMLPSKQQLDAAFDGAVRGVLKEGEFWYAGRMGARFVRKSKRTATKDRSEDGN